MNRHEDARPRVVRVEQIMGMPIIIDARDPSANPSHLEAAFELFRNVDARFSPYKETSEITRLNRGELALSDAHEDVRFVLERCDELREQTGGYFDVRIAGRALGSGGTVAVGPNAIDPSGYVKGWAIGQAVNLLAEVGLDNFCINAGGDIVVRGFAPPTPYWEIGIQHPYLRDKLATVVRVMDTAVATSGTYERGAHIASPRTGDAPEGVLSVTMVGPDPGVADAYATAAFAMGMAGPAWTARLDDYEAMTILADERVLTTPGFPSVS